MTTHVATTTYPGILRLDTVDDALGPAAGRFFGTGYQRVRYALDDATFSRSGGTLTGRAALTISYPVDWSRKDGQRRVPHLSTIDALVVAARATEQALVASGVPASALPAAFVRSVRIRAGARPVEQLGRIDVRCIRRGTPRPVEETDPPGAVRSVFEIAIGTMHTDIEVEHPAARAGGHHPSYEPPANGLYVDGFAERRLSIKGIRADLDTLAVTGDVRLSATRPPSRAGIEGGYAPAVTIFDAFVTTLQLGQVLLYAHDRVSRDASNNLWMRQTRIVRNRPAAQGHAPVRASTRLRNVDLLGKGGHRWRTADVVGELAGIQVSCSVTHQLPDSNRP
ncbi:AvrD family protein [Micromonospora sp. WMMD714]|uniref:AvrD family protein n=1 Tax=Micromonospora sp. WMMD714 TaxID=3016097 RepID=UPI00249ADBF4|nr:AvrD family protein [Micromonospora sp. WMMD714]WFE64314.1 AvrD family protein [Micromonospora sp. WMMD714]